MRFRLQGTIQAPRDEVMRVFHDSTEEIAKELPDIADVEVVMREPALTHLRWRATASVPRAFDKVVNADDLTWDDESTWNYDDGRVDVNVHKPGNEELQYISVILFIVDEENPNKTRYSLEGRLNIDNSLMGPMLERFVMGHLEPNMRKFFDALAARFPSEPSDVSP